LITVNNANSNTLSYKHQQRRQHHAVEQAPQVPLPTQHQRDSNKFRRQHPIQAIESPRRTDSNKLRRQRPIPAIESPNNPDSNTLRRHRFKPSNHQQPSRNSSPTEAEASTAPQRPTPAATYAAPPSAS
jgi:hypothetical protein